MRKLKFTTQLLVLFCLLLCISGGLFSILVIGRINLISEVQTFERLHSYIAITKTEWSSDILIDIEQADLNATAVQGTIVIEDGVYLPTDLQLSQNYSKYITKNDVYDLLKEIELKPGANGSQTIKSSTGKKLYFSYSIESPSDEEINFVIVITNTSLIKRFRESIGTQVILIFAAVLLFAFLILGVWGGAYVSRTKRLKMHIADLQRSGYKNEYLDDGEDELAELSASVETLRKEILKNEITKQEMLQNLSHDFKTPIAVIKSYAEAILDNMAEPSDANIIMNQADILEYKVNQLLQYNRLEYLEKKDEFIDCPISEIINSVVNTYRYQIENIEFILDLDDSKFKGYNENYYTIIDNIIDNAKRYAKTKIEITLRNGVLSFYNDGEHIDDQFINNSFKAYEKGSKGQFGLGMSIVKKTLDFFDYDLDVKNEDVGVRFTISKKVKKNYYTQ